MGGGSTQQSKASSKSYGVSKSPEQEYAAGHTIMDWYYPQVGKGENVYPGERVAPFSAGQQQALQVAQQYLDYFQPQATQNIPLYGETQQSLQGLLAGTSGAQAITPEQEAEYFSRVYEQPTMATWQRGVAPAIREAYAGPGYFGSGRAGAEVAGATQLGEWLGQQRGQVAWDVLGRNQQLEEAKAGRALQATGPAMQAAMLPTQQRIANLTGLQGAMGMLNQEQQQRQSQIIANIEKFAEENRITAQEDMNLLMALLGLDYSTERASSSAFSYGVSGYYGGGAGGGGK